MHSLPFLASVVAALLAPRGTAGTADPSSLSNTASAPQSAEDGVLLVTEPGRYPLSHGLEVECTADLAPTEPPSTELSVRRTLILHWPATEGRPALRYEVEVPASLHPDGVTEGRFAMAHERGTSLLAVVDESWVQVLDLSDPARIRTTGGGRNDNGGFGPLSARVREALETRIPVGRKDGSIGGNLGMDRTSSAVTEDCWSFEGTVRSGDGVPLAGVRIEARSERDFTKLLGETGTDTDGRFRVDLRVDFAALQDGWRGLFVQPRLPGHCEERFAVGGEWTLRLGGEDRARSSFSPRSLELGARAQLEFVLLPARDLSGVLVDESGSVCARGYVAVLDPAGRPGYPLCSGTTDAEGRFHLRDVPTHTPVVLLAAPTVDQSATSEPLLFGAGSAQELRLRMGEVCGVGSIRALAVER